VIRAGFPRRPEARHRWSGDGVAEPR